MDTGQHLVLVAVTDTRVDVDLHIVLDTGALAVALVRVEQLLLPVADHFPAVEQNTAGRRGGR